MQTYPAVVLAGYSPRKPDPLALALGAERKALIEVAGKAMVQWVVQALRASGRIGLIAVVGVGPEDGADLGDVLHVPNQEGQFDNTLAGIRAVQERAPQTEMVVVASGDIPLLRAETVDWYVDTCERRPVDFYYTLIEQKVMEKQYPGSGRSYVPLVEGRFCGGDLSWVRAAVVRNNEQLVRDLLARRKNAFAQIRLAGYGTILKFLLRRLSIRDAERVGSRLMHCDTRIIVSPYADMGMDVDKPHQLDMARRILGAAA